MKLNKKIIIALFFILLILLIIFFSKDFIIRQYFISKIENIDYKEYILTASSNNKKIAIYYYTSDTMYRRTYNDNEELNDDISILDYAKSIEYTYDINNHTTSPTNNINFSRDFNVNNDNLLEFLRNTTEQTKFTYKGSETINNRDCYVFEFERFDESTYTIYLDKELLYTVRVQLYNPNFDDLHDNSNNKYIIHNYTLDLDLKDKDLFKMNI